MDNAEWFRKYMREASANLGEVGDLCADQVAQASSVIASVFAQGHRLLLCGNGTDASMCEIIASRFQSRLAKTLSRPGWPAISLPSNTNFLTGHSNRFGQDEVYARLVTALGAKGDALLAIESGEPSENVPWGIRRAEAMGLHTLALTGFTSKLTKMATIVVKVPLKDPIRIAEAHMAIQNAICFLVEKELLQ